MIRQICPHCFQPVELPDSAAGSAALCPKCKQAFPVPGAYSPTVDAAAGPSPAPAPTPASVDRPPPPPGLAPNAVPGFFASGSSSSAPSTPSGGYEHSCGVTLSSHVLGWVPAICLTLIFLLTFFTWVGTYAGGNPLYTQNAWQTLFGKFSINPTVSDEIMSDQNDVKSQMRSDWLLMLPYILILIASLVAAWGERVVKNPEQAPLPAHLTAKIKPLWPWRYAILTGLTSLLLLFLSIQCWFGFGLETAVQARINKQFEEQINNANTDNLKRNVEIKKGLAVNQTGLDDTTALDIVVYGHVIAVVFFAALFWLERRGNKPSPRLVLHY